MPKAKTQKPRGSAGRPKAPKVKKHWVSFRVTAEELFQLMAKAERSGMSHGEFARSRALRGIARKKKSAGPHMPPFDLSFDGDAREILHEARRQGVNLNQIARQCNSLKEPPPPQFAELLQKLSAIWDKLLA